MCMSVSCSVCMILFIDAGLGFKESHNRIRDEIVQILPAFALLHRNLLLYFSGDGSSKDACNYIRERYLERNRNETKEIYVHFTCATDTANIDFVFKAVTNMIIAANLKKSGLT